MIYRNMQLCLKAIISILNFVTKRLECLFTNFVPLSFMNFYLYFVSAQNHFKSLANLTVFLKLLENYKCSLTYCKITKNKPQMFQKSNIKLLNLSQTIVTLKKKIKKYSQFSCEVISSPITVIFLFFLCFGENLSRSRRLFTQDKVDDGRDESQTKGNPGQNE